MKTNLLIFVAVLLISSGLMGQRSIWQPGSDVNGSGLWDDPVNWDTGLLPGTTDDGRAIFRGGECFVRTDVSGTFRVELGDNKDLNRAVLTIENGGILGANRIFSGHSEVGIWAPATLIVEEGGSMSTGTHFWIGTTKNYTIDTDLNHDANMGSEVHINGGTITVREMFGIDFYNDKESSGGTLFLNGGLLDLAQWNPGNPDEENANASLGKNGKIAYTDGLMRIKGNHKASLERFRDNGQITGDFEIWVEETIDMIDDGEGGQIADTTYVTKLSNIKVNEITIAGEDGETTITKGGGTLKMLATVLPENATDPSVSWSVNDEAVATIDADGLLTAISNGNVTVTATANDGSGITGELVISVAIPTTTVWNPAANNPSDGLWTTAANWTNGLPHKDSKVVFNVLDAIDCIVDVEISPSIQIVQGDGGSGNGGVLHIKNGGVINTRTTSWSAIGWNKPAKLIVDQGGEITFGQHMWIGHNAGANDSEVLINGGAVNILGQFGMDWNGAGNSVTLYLNNGLLNLAQIHATTSLGANSKIIIDAGLMQIAGDLKTTMQAYIDAGKIIATEGGKIEILIEEIEGVTYTKLSRVDIKVTDITVTGQDGANTITTDGGTLQMFATVLPADADDKTVTWSVNDEDVATIDANGLLTAKADGVVTVTATANDGSEIIGSLDITISGQSIPVIEVTEITVEGENGLTTITSVGGTLQMLATVLPDNATDPSVAWSVNDEAVATIDAEGLLTAVANGNVTVMATANDGSGVTGELVVSVALPATTIWNPAAYIESNGLWTEKENWTQGLPHLDSKVVFNVEDAADCVLDAEATVKQIVVGDNGAGDDVLRITEGGNLTTGSAWSSVAWNTDATLIVEKGGTLTFGQHFWAGANGHAIVEIYGTVNVTGMFGIAFEPAWNGSCHLSVNDNGVLNLANIHPDQSIPNGSYLDINDNGVINLKGDHLTKIENYITLGLITTNNGAGIPNVELVGEDDNLKTVISVNKEVTEITVAGEGGVSTITTKGGTLQMVATVLPADASDASVTWSVNDDAVATIDADGLLTAVSNGSVTVIATANDGSGTTGEVIITITMQDTSVWSAATNKTINIFPNPVATDIIYLQNVTNADVEIYNLTGQTVIVRTNTAQVNIQDLEPGIYFVRITSDGIMQTKKLVRK